MTHHKPPHPSSYRRLLPHWRSTGASYFVTWSLRHRNHPLEPEERSIIFDSLLHFNRQRYTLSAAVVMNDHVHVVVEPYDGYSLASLNHSWKSYSAHKIAGLGFRAGDVWQYESYDWLIRNPRDHWIKIRYVLSNPVRRWPGIEEYRWVWPGLMRG